VGGWCPRPRRELDAAPAFRELQFQRWLVRDDQSRHHRDWEAESGQKWTVPVGAGVRKLFKLGKLPINTSQLGFQVQFLLPSFK